MTDKELIQAFKICLFGKCRDCPYHRKKECEEVSVNNAITRLEALLAENERLKAGKDTNVPTKWVSVEEGLPKAGIRVIVARKDGKVEQGVYLSVNGFWKVYGANTKQITHWMPLPEPPRTEVEQCTS